MSDGSVSSSSGEPLFESPDNSDSDDDDDDDSDNNNNDGTESSHGSPSKPHGSHKKKTAAIDPFKFQARSFQKVNTAITSAQQHPSPSRKKKRTRTDDTGDELERSLEESKGKSQAHLMASQQKLRKRKMVNENENKDSDESDDDSDGDVLDGRAGVKDANKQSKEKSRNGEGSVSKHQDPQEQNVIELLSDDDKEPADVEKKPSANATVRRSPRIARCAASASVAVALSTTSKITPPAYDNSTDDDSDKEMSAGAVARSLTRRNNNPLPAGAAEAMMRARMAQSKLTQAQHYHAHDLYVPVKEPKLIQRRPTSAPSSARKPLSGIKAAALNLGIPLKVVCRTQLHITTEQKKRTQDVKLSIRDKEPLQELYNRLFQELALPPTATLTMSFDGMHIENSKTPKSYDMEDGDLIDCTAQAAYLLTTKRESTPVIPTSLDVKKISLGKRLKLNCRAQVKLSGTQQQKKAHHLLSSNLELREHEPLSILLDSMVKAHNIPTTAKVKMLFDGEVCNLEKTPTNYGMEADDMIDFTVEVARFWL
ncbi:ubiquitin-2/rad60 SUMO-like protein [Nitzschia inconspicua]|uniref:Ubiquitin-2/rad60 SUMO-like protein n=1 Tax=Nitzschia inconspicua TaxID=303405 RepID=A0A9K3KIF4_9STRA|nr:ubiquitin-2/rad60 SUMO-like protein [Nitzschia inconspicua]